MDQEILFTLSILAAVCGVTACVPHQYHFVNETKTWDDSQRYCKEKNTDLATINSTEEMNKLNAILKDKPKNYVWIGVKRENGGGWQWSLVDRMINQTNVKWCSGEPNNAGGSEYCVMMSSDQGCLLDENCDRTHPFVCYNDQFILINQNLTWTEALRYCRDHHVDLVSVHTEEIQRWVKEVVEDASTEHVWMGLGYTCTLGFWYWLTGDYFCYQNWAPGNGTGEEDCSHGDRFGAVQSGEEMQWVSLTVDQKLNFICTRY